jgi:hypothetical protein
VARYDGNGLEGQDLPPHYFEYPKRNPETVKYDIDFLTSRIPNMGQTARKASTSSSSSSSSSTTTTTTTTTTASSALSSPLTMMIPTTTPQLNHYIDRREQEEVAYELKKKEFYKKKNPRSIMGYESLPDQIQAELLMEKKLKEDKKNGKITLDSGLNLKSQFVFGATQRLKNYKEYLSNDDGGGSGESQNRQGLQRYLNYESNTSTLNYKSTKKEEKKEKKTESKWAFLNLKSNVLFDDEFKKPSRTTVVVQRKSESNNIKSFNYESNPGGLFSPLEKTNKNTKSTALATSASSLHNTSEQFASVVFGGGSIDEDSYRLAIISKLKEKTVGRVLNYMSYDHKNTTTTTSTTSKNPSASHTKFNVSQIVFGQDDGTAERKKQQQQLFSHGGCLGKESSV